MSATSITHERGEMMEHRCKNGLWLSTVADAGPTAPADATGDEPSGSVMDAVMVDDE